MTTTELVKKEEARVPAPRITPETIQETMQSIALLQGMVKDLLIRGVDYGRIPGTPQDSLWDPGASQIINAFNCYPGERRMLKLDDSTEKIVVCVEVPLISRTTGLTVGTGVGAASTLETKYKYRWVDDPLQWGYDETATKTFKTKQGRDDEGDETTLYRIPNPEHSELLNTILKMASKRAEVDGAESLPGVSSVLRQIFSGKKGARGEYEGPVWPRFWGEVRRLGMTDQEAHTKLGVASMKDWLGKGRSLDQALAILRGHGLVTTETIKRTFGQDVAEQFNVAKVVEPEAAEEEPTRVPAKPKVKRDPETIKTIQDLYKACHEDFWVAGMPGEKAHRMQPKEVLKELGYSSQEDISDTPANYYRQIAAVRQ